MEVETVAAALVNVTEAVPEGIGTLIKVAPVHSSLAGFAAQLPRVALDVEPEHLQGEHAVATAFTHVEPQPIEHAGLPIPK